MLLVIANDTQLDLEIGFAVKNATLPMINIQMTMSGSEEAFRKAGWQQRV